MMLLLHGDVLLHLFEIRLADAEIRVAALPTRSRRNRDRVPSARDSRRVSIPSPFGLRDRASEAGEQIDVLIHAAEEKGRAIELFGDAAGIRLERVARGFVAQEQPTRGRDVPGSRG